MFAGSLARATLPAKPLDETAEPRGVRPRVEAAAAAVRTLGDPDLLERRPVVRSSLTPEQVGPVKALEDAVHLQPAVVAVARVRRPRALEAVDAHELAPMRRMQRAQVRSQRTPLPQRAHPFSVFRARVDLRMIAVRRAPDAHHLLPVPRMGAVGVDLRENRRIGLLPRRNLARTYGEADDGCSREHGKAR